MKIEIDTNKDSEEEIRHIVKMLMNLLGDNVAFQTEIAREEIIKKSKSAYGSESSSNDSSSEPAPEVSDEGGFADFNFFDENKEEAKQPENRVVNEPKEKARAKEVEEEEEFDFSKLMEY